MQFRSQIIRKLPLASLNCMIQSFTRDGFFGRCLNLYSQIYKEGHHGDNFTFPSVAKACAKLGLIKDGMKLHAHIILLGFQPDVYVQTALMDMYSKCSNLSASRQLFDEMIVKALVSWNSMIYAYCRASMVDESFGLLKQMQVLGLEPNSSTFVSVVSGCQGPSHGLSIHGCVIKLGFHSDVLLSNSIMNMYVRFDALDSARILFDLMKEKSEVSWTTIVGGYLKLGNFGEAFFLFNQMRHGGISPDIVAFVNLLSSCAQLGGWRIGSCVHAFTLKCGCEREDLIGNSLVSMYGECGDLISAQKVFDLMHEKDIFLWTSMIGGCVQNGRSDDALSLFESLLTTNIKPNKITLITTLSACADLGSLSAGEKVVEYVKVNGFETDLQVQTSLIHMYCKCGSIEQAKEVFNRVLNKDIAVWSSMIRGFATHGKGEEALSLFEEMLREGIKPDSIVFTGILSACGHSGLVEDGLKYFNSMQRDFRIKPSIEHCSCLVDLLGRAGHLDLAFKMIQQMSVKTQGHVWTALLSACRTHRNVQIGESVAQHLFHTEPWCTRNYILISSIYGSAGRWQDAARVRRLMNNRGLVKEPGWSRIEIDGFSHVFRAGDKSHYRMVEIYEKLEELNTSIREVGYIAKNRHSDA